MKKFTFLLYFTFLLVGAYIATNVLDLNRYVASFIIGFVLYFLYLAAGLTKKEIGAGGPSKQAYVWAVSTLAILFVAFGLAYLVLPDVFKDNRYNQPLDTTLKAMFLMLPLTTVVIEEFAFRGLLLGFLLKTGPKKQALLISSLLFGLWHIPSSFFVNVDSFLFIKHPPQLLITIAIVVATSVAGYVFSLLRLKTKSLLVSITAHWCINALGMLFAWLAWNR